MTDLALAAGAAAAAVLPSVEPLSALGTQPGDAGVLEGFAAAVVADLDGPRGGRIALLVGGELTAALADSPIDGLDLGAATQPALDAAAAALEANARAARVVPLDLALDGLTSFTAVPLAGSQVAAALLVDDALLVVPAADPSFAATTPPAATEPPADNVTALPRRGIEMLHGVDMEVTVELGRTRMTVRDLLALTPGAVLELDRAAGSPADLLVNGRLIARGEVVVVDEDFGLRVTEIVDDSATG
ncbi:MAG: flagellar motor switch protein FliN [Nocardioidaceae bacterium]|nr:flagellar motor switch protein FliN [Nocardioidaceae bacterium]